VGIHLGDIVAEHGDLLGDGVNVAARLVGISPTVGITISVMLIGSGGQGGRRVRRPLRTEPEEHGPACLVV
jgi:class 3 adenylate cyclase